MSGLKKIVALSAVRTPLGRFGGTLKKVSSYELGSVAILHALERAKVESSAVTEVLMGNCRQAGNGPNPARTASLLAGIPVDVPSTTINMACPSAMKAVFLAANELELSKAEFIIAGGMDSMSTIPHLVKGVRFNTLKMGNLVIEDGWNDATDPIINASMGQTAVAIAKEFCISRQSQDQFAFESHQKAVSAKEKGLISEEIVPIHLPPANGHQQIDLIEDETPRKDTSLEKLSKLPAVFDKKGTISAGNSCAMADGACALLLCQEQTAKAHGLKPVFSIMSTASTAVKGSLMGHGPAYSIPMALKKAGLTLDDIDLIEINEAFSATVLANIETLKIDTHKLNVYGGAIAYGHPTGISGAKIVVTLANALRKNNKELGLAAICGAGGVTTAMIIKIEY